MKTPIISRNSFRASPIRAGALLAVCLGALTMSAQSGTSSSSSATSSPSNDHQDRTAVPDSNATTGATAGSMTGADRLDGGGTALKRGDRRFITKAAESSMKEVALSQLAQERATNPAIKNFAQQMVTDHSQLNSDLMQLAQRKGVMLDNAPLAGSSAALRSPAAKPSSSTDTAATMPANGGAMTGNDMADATRTAGAARETDATSDRHYRSLAKKSGADFDKEYADLMVDDHESAVKLFEKTAKDAKDPEVRSFASSHLPTLQAHLQHVQGLLKSVAE